MLRGSTKGELEQQEDRPSYEGVKAAIYFLIDS